MEFVVLAQRVELGIVLSFERHKYCNRWFKTNETIEYYHSTLSLPKSNPTWLTGERGLKDQDTFSLFLSFKALKAERA